MKTFALILLALALGGCTSVETVSLNHSSPERLTTIPPAEIAIYRSQNPSYTFDEIGLITVKGSNPSVEKIYPLLREEASRKGADAVVKLRILTEKVTVPQSATVCNGQGNCSTSVSYHTEIRFTASGTLVRKKGKS